VVDNAVRKSSDEVRKVEDLMRKQFLDIEAQMSEQAKYVSSKLSDTNCRLEAVQENVE